MTLFRQTVKTQLSSYLNDFSLAGRYLKEALNYYQVVGNRGFIRRTIDLLAKGRPELGRVGQ